MPHNRHHSGSTDRLKHLRLIGLLLLVCLGLMGLHGLRLGLDLFGGDGRQTAVAGGQDVPGVADESRRNSQVQGGIIDATVTDPQTVRNETPPQDLHTPLGSPSTGRGGADDSAQKVSEKTAVLSESLGKFASVSRQWARKAQQRAAALSAAIEPRLDQRDTMHSSDASTLTPSGSDPTDSNSRIVTSVDANAREFARIREAREVSTVVLFNRENGVIKYLLDAQVHSLEPGQIHFVDDGGPWTIRFHRGGEFGNATVLLNGGTYEFSVTESGWNLQPRRFDADPPAN